MNTIILNSKNIINSNNNQLRYQFPSPKNLSNHQIAVSSVQIFYSWFNISSSNNNNSYQYKWVDGLYYNVNIPDGFYTVQQLSVHLQATMISNSHYLLNANTKTNVYAIEFVTNPTLYACQINSYPISQALATSSGWTLPTS